MELHQVNSGRFWRLQGAQGRSLVNICFRVKHHQCFDLTCGYAFERISSGAGVSC